MVVFLVFIVEDGNLYFFIFEILYSLHLTSLALFVSVDFFVYQVDPCEKTRKPLNLLDLNFLFFLFATFDDNVLAIGL